ncbi:MAG: phosphate/phosphite/phosphonate ABC transporter substrate-binding protein [Synechococcus sp. SB0666_bin_14]|nr:phosphate/phosphite/phosphonate ABC transporter substrate-binding protein [Synechococcus sp. SB0666_bin_14]MYA91755.1 phosphate/phosphite/phosphonate ABC transporter substrate-binding protein [Synechococcus sp. SB0663_bin_10]MYG46342.1 phosphate/phosphite/phosphonate ABC transporter substrate-binding protein [Synechococcus sp. SB0675_bin_6]MYK91000.1 phosphate/phosphite/phosphonate ABC transporter substrate-binding protein [Synechococcus sp. SB0669_bin_8]
MGIGKGEVKRAVGTAACCCMVLLASACGGGPKDSPDARSTAVKTLVVALVPDEDAATVIQDNQGLKSYLETTLDVPVELVVSTDYSTLIEAATRNKSHLTYFGPLSYVIARSRAPFLEPFAVRLKDGASTYEAVLIGNREQGIRTFDDIKGKTVALGDPASTGSRLFPQLRLADAGLQPNVDYQPVFLGAHDAVAKAVERGTAAAGGLSRTIYDKLVEQGTINPDKLVVLGASSPIPQYPWTMDSGLNEDLRHAIKQSFYDLEDPALLQPLRADGFVPVQDSDYDGVRRAADVLGLSLQDLVTEP